MKRTEPTNYITPWCLYEFLLIFNLNCNVDNCGFTINDCFRSLMERWKVLYIFNSF